MIVDFFRHGSGLSKGCLDYLLGEDREREHAQVLSGDVELTAQLIDSSPFAKKYTSGCLSFYEHDLSDQDKQKIMQNFEECLFPGLDKDQYQILWVQHQDKINQDTGETRLELNFVIPNVELSTGKRLQPFYAPADLDRVDLFKQIINTEHSLYDPDDPEHRQLFLNKKNLPKDIKDFKEQLHQRVYRAVSNGEVADRQELVQWLESNQINVTRQVKNSISIENPYEGAKRPIRLEGEIYEQGLELLANIDKKYNNELKNTEEQLLSGIEQTSQAIRDSLNTRANITATAIQQSDEKIAQSIQNNAQTVEKRLSQYQSLLQSTLSHLTQLNEQLQSQEQQAQNQAVQKKLTILNMGLISAAVILLIAIFSLGLVTKNKYSEMQTLNTVINEKQMRVDHLNRSGGSLTISTCKRPDSKAQRLCIQINKNAGEWQNGYMIPMGY